MFCNFVCVNLYNFFYVTFLVIHLQYNNHFYYKSENIDSKIVNGLQELFKNKLLYSLFRFHCSPRLKLPLKEIWVKYLLNRFSSFADKESIVIFSADYYSFLSQTSFFLRLKEKYSCTIVLSFKDKADLYLKNKRFSLKKAKDCFDLVMTYNAFDADKYEIAKTPHLFVNIKTMPFAAKEKDIDLFFVGQDKGRIQLINSTYRKCIGLGLKCQFFVVGKTDGEKVDGIHYTDRIPYEQVLSFVGRSKCVFNIVQPGSTGITLRDYEALNFGIYMLSNRRLDESDELYKPGQFISIEDPDFGEKMRNATKNHNLFCLGQNAWTLDDYVVSLIDLIQSENKRKVGEEI